MTRLSIVWDSLTGREFALLNPFHQVPRALIRSNNLINPKIEELVLGSFNSSPTEEPILVRFLQLILTKRFSALVIPLGLQVLSDADFVRMLIPCRGEHVSQGLGHSINVSSGVQGPRHNGWDPFSEIVNECLLGI